jgi:hypothetical protein
MHNKNNEHKTHKIFPFDSGRHLKELESCFVSFEKEIFDYEAPLIDPIITSSFKLHIK